MRTNQAVSQGFLEPGQTLVCIGDSITVAPEGYVTTAAETLALKLPDCPPRVVNAGANADTVTQMLARFERDVLAHEPDWVSIMAGVADTVWELQGRPDATDPSQLGNNPQQFGQAIEQMVDMAHTAGARVALCTPNHFEYHWSGEARRANCSIRAKTEYLHRVAEQESVLLMPTGEVLLTAARAAARRGQWLLLTKDGLHPDETGHALMALAFLAGFGYTLQLPQLA